MQTDSQSAVVHLSLFPRFILNLDRDLESRFLGSDLSEICEAAYDSDIPILKAFAASPLEKREEALAAWRAAQVKNMVDDHTFAALVTAFLKDAPTSLVESFRAGKMRLADVDSEIKKLWHDSESDRINSRRAAKDRLWDVVRLKLIDHQEEKHFGKTVPRQLLILENGKMEIFRYRTNAILFAKKSGMSYLLMGIDGTRVKAGNLEGPGELSAVEAEAEARELDEIDDFTEQTQGVKDPIDDDDADG